MPNHIALLRAVNVGGTGRLSMTALTKLFVELGFDGARTLSSTGNVVFDGGKRSTAQLETFLEKETKKRLAFHVDYFVRDAPAWRKIIAANPFSKEAETDPSHLLVFAMKTAAARKDVVALQGVISGREYVHGNGSALYAVYPDGIAGSKLTIKLIEDSLGSRGTGRNWNTVLKLAALTA